MNKQFRNKKINNVSIFQTINKKFYFGKLYKKCGVKPPSKIGVPSNSRFSCVAIPGETSMKLFNT